MLAQETDFRASQYFWILALKLELIQRLVDSGVRRMEAVSFVNPNRVPQMADAEQVIQGLPKQDGSNIHRSCFEYAWL